MIERGPSGEPLAHDLIDRFAAEKDIVSALMHDDAEPVNAPS